MLLESPVFVLPQSTRLIHHRAQMSTHKALLLEKKFGGYAVGDIPTPKPGPGELLVKVHAAALNPVDWKIQKYGIFIETFPAILGSDVAGEVVELGTGVSSFKVGDRV